METPQLSLWVTYTQCSVTLIMKNCFLMLRGHLPCVCAHSLLSCHWAQPGSMLFAHWLQIFPHISKIQLSLVSLLSSQKKCQSPNHPCSLFTVLLHSFPRLSSTEASPAQGLCSRPALSSTTSSLCLWTARVAMHPRSPLLSFRHGHLCWLLCQVGSPPDPLGFPLRTRPDRVPPDGSCPPVLRLPCPC